MRAPKLRELAEAIKSLISKPATSMFPARPHEPYEGFRGKPEFSEAGCVGCGACAQVCPAGAIEVVDPDPSVEEWTVPMRRLTVHYDQCNFCGNCQAHCITGEGIRLTPQYDLALFDRQLAHEFVEMELVRCDLCGAALTTRKHLLWIARRLGPLAYGNPTLLLTAQRAHLPVESGRAGASLRRPDLFKVLCPRCRKSVMLKDIYG